MKPEVNTKIWRAAVVALVLPLGSWCLVTANDNGKKLEKYEVVQAQIREDLEELKDGIKELQELQKDTLETVIEIRVKQTAVKGALEAEIDRSKDADKRHDKALEKLQNGVN